MIPVLGNWPWGGDKIGVGATRPYNKTKSN